MPVLQEPLNLGDLLKYEAPNLYSRDQATVASGQNLKLGSVVGLETASGKLKAWNPAATDGTEQAVGVLALEVDASLADRTDAILIARHAILADHALAWPTGVTPEQKAAAIAQLKALGLLIRTGV